MALVTNTSATTFEDESEAIQAARKAQLDAYNAALLSAGETPNPTQDSSDTITAYDAQTGAQFSVPIGTVGGGGIDGALVATENLADVTDPVVAAENLGIFAVGTLSNPRILAPVQWYWGAHNESIVGTEEDDPYSSTNGGTISAVDSGGPLFGAIPTPLESVSGGVSNIMGSTVVPLGSPASVTAGVQVGDRVFYNDRVNAGHQGVYVVSDVGSINAPWSMVRAADHPVSQLTQAFKVGVEGTNIVIQSSVNETDPEYIWPAVSSGATLTLGKAALATGAKSIVLGESSTATEYSSIALGGNAHVTASGAIQIGAGYNGDVNSTHVTRANIEYNIQLPSVDAGIVNISMTLGNLWYVGISSAVEFTVGGDDGDDAKVCVKVSSGGPHALTFPAGWVWLGTVPTTIAAGKTAVLSITRFQSAYVASWAVQA